jgi:hypothetical protein
MGGWVGAMGGGGRGRKGKKVALDDAVLRVGLKTNSRLTGGEQRGHEPRHGE